MGLVKYALRKATGRLFLWIDVNINHKLQIGCLPLFLGQYVANRFCIFVSDYFGDFDD